MVKYFSLKVNSLLVNDEETNGSGGEMEEAVEEEIEVFLLPHEDENRIRKMYI